MSPVQKSFIISFLLIAGIVSGGSSSFAYFGIETLKIPEKIVPRTTDQVPVRRKSQSTLQRRSDLSTSAQKELAAPRRILQAVPKEEDPCADLRGIPHARCVFESKRKEELAAKRERRVYVDTIRYYGLPPAIEREYSIAERTRMRAAERLQLER